jgi:hypothetical protein
MGLVADPQPTGQAPTAGTAAPARGRAGAVQGPEREGDGEIAPGRRCG